MRIDEYFQDKKKYEIWENKNKLKLSVFLNNHKNYVGLYDTAAKIAEGIL